MAAIKPLNEAFDPYVQMIHKDFNAGFHFLVEGDDKHPGIDGNSTREWLHREKIMDFNEIQKLETFDTYVKLHKQLSYYSYADFGA